ncbi:thioredoxin family protein [Calidifontibacillus oryziterrae]|uniref:thioredoxin family protein n=1 Tax=Calidifontibacillus oryziterrae TaxID=1191699 RepID=UPI0002FFC7C9|nr:thioredoxin family protein [Calidifontibacillus oryziterrae]
MQELHSLEEIITFTNEQPLTFLYFSHPACNVCHSVFPKVENILMNDFPEIAFGKINTEEVPECAGHFSIFTVPSMILFAEGKEVMRQARFVVLDDLKAQINKIYSCFY